MQIAQQENFRELEMNLGKVAQNRAFLFEFLADLLKLPTMDLLERLLSGELYSEIEKSVTWVNESSGIFDSPLKKLKDVTENNSYLDMLDVLEKLEDDFVSVFLSETGSISPYEAGYITDEEHLMSLKKFYDAEPEFTLRNEQIMDHLENELLYLAYLCRKEGEAWNNGIGGKAKQWRRKERDFTLSHLGKWGERFFADFEKKANTDVYKSLSSLGRIFMKLEQGY